MTETRIDRRFKACAEKGRPALVTFITAGDPDLETSQAILEALPAAGADGKAWLPGVAGWIEGVRWT